MSRPTELSATEQTLPALDVERAQAGSMQFSVQAKEKHGAPWQKVSTGLGLNAAIDLARDLANQHFEVAVFHKGFLYWSTRRPTFNSSVLDH